MEQSQRVDRASGSPDPVEVNHHGKESAYDRRRREKLAATESFVETWKAELERYLGAAHETVTKDTDLVRWWSVSFHVVLTYRTTSLNICDAPGARVGVSYARTRGH